MNKTGIVGHWDGVECEFKAKPLENEIVILRYDCEKMDLDMMCRHFKEAKKHFPSNTVIVLPSDSEIEYGEVDVLMSFRDMLNDVIKEKLNA